MIFATALFAFLFAGQHVEARSLTCRASWYGVESGRTTANGERFNPRAFTAASRTLPFGTVIEVRYRNRRVRLRINDRGPARWTGRCLDVTRAAARTLGFAGRGTALVTISR